MRIQGFQKMTMLDYPGRVAATVFTPGCDLRCPFCHNAPLVTHIAPEERIPEEEVLAYLEKRRGLLDGLVVTGGEPLLQPDLGRFLERVKALGYAVKLDSNGCHPDALKALVQAGLTDYIAVDIKNAPGNYAETTGMAHFNPAPLEETIAFLRSGSVAYEFRTTVVKELHRLEDFEAMGQWICGADRWFLQGFVDSGDLIRPGFHPPDRDFLLAAAQIARKFVKNVEIRGVDL